MTKPYFLVLLLCSLFFMHNAFGQATETRADFHDGTYPAFTTDYRFSSDMVTAAIRQRLKEDKINAHSKKDVISGEGVHYDVLTPQAIDLYFQIKGKGRKGRDGATVTMFISKGKDNFVGSTQDPELGQNAIQYLNNLRHYITLYDLGQQIKTQRSAVDKQTKDYNKMLKSARKAESKRYGLQGDLSKETDPGKQDKLRDKIDKAGKDIYQKQRDITDAQQNLQRLKDQLNMLQNQLDREKTVQ